MNWRQWSQRDWKAEFYQLYQQLPVSLLNKAFALLLVVFLAWQASQLTWLVVPAPVASSDNGCAKNQLEFKTDRRRVNQQRSP